MTARLERVSAPVLLLIAAAAISAGLLFVLNSHIEFFLDDWDLLLHRRGFDADAFFRPHNEHIIVGPAIVYKAIQATLGMDSPRPYQAVAIATFVASAALLFVWLRERVGGWLALFGAVAILFLGTAFEDLLSAFQIGFFGSMSLGLATLLALERETRRADALACALLTGSVAFSSLGLPFLAAAAVAVALGPRPTWARRAYVVVVPAALFALWWIGWGHTASSHVDFQSVVDTPGFVLDGLAASLGSLFGLAAPSNPPATSPIDWGRPLLVAAIGLGAWRIHRLGGVPRGLWIVAALGLGFWVLAGVNEVLFRLPTVPRYMYMGAVIWIMVAAELLRGVRPGRAALLAIFVVGLATIAGNLVNLRDGYRIFKPVSEAQRGGITGLEIARDTVAPDFLLTEENADSPYFDYVDAASYLSAVDAFGSPGYTEADLAAAPEPVRVAADKATAAALRLELAPADTGCPPPGLREGEAELGPGTVTVTAGPGATPVSLRRFATESHPVVVGRLRAGRSATLTIPQDRALTPWRLELAGLEVCRGS